MNPPIRVFDPSYKIDLDNNGTYDQFEVHVTRRLNRDVLEIWIDEGAGSKRLMVQKSLTGFEGEAVQIYVSGGDVHNPADKILSDRSANDMLTIRSDGTYDFESNQRASQTPAGWTQKRSTIRA